MKQEYQQELINNIKKNRGKKKEEGGQKGQEGQEEQEADTTARTHIRPHAAGPRLAPMRAGGRVGGNGLGCHIVGKHLIIWRVVQYFFNEPMQILVRDT